MWKCPQTGKETHSSRGVALAHLRNLKETRGYEGEAYFCPHCSGWHVGRARERTHKNKYKPGR